MYNIRESDIMVFQSNLRYENGTAQLKQAAAGVYVIETNVKPVYSYFRPDSKQETVEPTSPAEHEQESDTNK